mgnify:CR=1 FL=1
MSKKATQGTQVPRRQKGDPGKQVHGRRAGDPREPWQCPFQQSSGGLQFFLVIRKGFPVAKDFTQLGHLFEQIGDAFGSLDILINNAASGVQRPASELTEKHWEWTMNVNARAPWLCSIEALRLMGEGGRIVNITSEGSRRVLPYYFSVGASKAALEAVTRYLAVELAPSGIVVNAVSGGYVDTGALDHFPTKEKMLEAGHDTPAGRMVTPEDIAGVVAFLCTEAAEMIRGQIILVDGGVTLTAG